MDSELREYLQNWLIEQGEDEELILALTDEVLLFLVKEKGLRLYKEI